MQPEAEELVFQEAEGDKYDRTRVVILAQEGGEMSWYYEEKGWLFANFV